MKANSEIDIRSAEADTAVGWPDGAKRAAESKDQSGR
jgi:hypothetical protein